MSNFYNNFVKLCNQAGMKPSAVAEDIGFSKSLVTRWKAGKGITDATACKIADYFDVTMDDLFYEEEMPMDVDPGDEDDWLIDELQMVRDSAGIRALLRSSKGLTEEQLEQVANLVSQMRRENVDDS